MLTYPLFLIGLTAVGIPIAIHLLQLRRYRKVYFSNVEMLEELESENRRQRNLRQLLILAARILAIVFLVLAFCQPVIPDKDTQMTSGGTAVSVYIDNSYSMECGGMDGSLIEAARQKAREIAAAYSPGTQFQLLTNNASGIQFRWMSHEEFLDAVNEVEAGAVTTPLSSIARRQNEFLHTSTAGNRHAYIVSDFQRTTADLASYPPDSTVLTTFIPLGGTDVANIYIDSLSFNSPSYFRGATVQVEARVRNDGDKAVEKQPLRLYVGNRERAVTSVDIGARSSATVQMTFSIQDDSLMQGYVETTDYPITFDDRMYFSIPVTPQVPMLVISGKDENSFLKRLFQGDSLVEYRQEPYNSMDYEHLSESRFIVLDELHAIPSGLAQSLVQFVKEGGTLLVTPGKGVEASSYNQLLGALQAPQLGRWSDRQVRSRDMASNHPLYQGVFLHTGAGAKSNGDEIEMPTVTGYYALQRTSGTVSRHRPSAPGAHRLYTPGTICPHAIQYGALQHSAAASLPPAHRHRPHTHCHTTRRRHSTQADQCRPQCPAHRVHPRHPPHSLPLLPHPPRRNCRGGELPPHPHPRGGAGLQLQQAGVKPFLLFSRRAETSCQRRRAYPLPHSAQGREIHDTIHPPAQSGHPPVALVHCPRPALPAGRDTAHPSRTKETHRSIIHACYKSTT